MSKKKECPAEHPFIHGVSWGKLSDPNVELLESRLFNIYTLYMLHVFCLGFLVNLKIFTQGKLLIHKVMSLQLPDKIFLSGAPGSKWNNIAEILSTLDNINTSDNNTLFGTGMKFEPRLDIDYINSAWSTPNGCKLVQSHEWCDQLSVVNHAFPEDWIMLIHRQQKPSLKTWLELGGYAIEYPDYSDFQDMPATIKRQNQGIMKWVFEKSCRLERFTPFWVEREFNQTVEFDQTQFDDVFVTVYKPELVK